MTRTDIRHPWTVVLALTGLLFVPVGALAADYYIDPVSGDDAASGMSGAPWRTISKAVAQLPEVVTDYVQVHLAPGAYTNTGGLGMPADTLVLDRRMRRTSQFLIDVSVHFLGRGTNFQGWAQPGQVVLDWGGTPLVVAKGGVWYFEHVQIGNRSREGSQEGVAAYGTDSLVNLRDVRIRTASARGAGIYATRGAEVRLYEDIELNEDLHDVSLTNSFCGISADYNGSVRCRDGSGTLSMGNGNLSVSYYGVIELGCQTAHITSWDRQANCFALNNSGRIDVHGTTTTLCAKHPDNTLIGPEDDGHILAEGATIILETLGGSQGRVVLQKASTLFGGPFVVSGPSAVSFQAMSGSVLVGNTTGRVDVVAASTGGYVCLWCATAPSNVVQTTGGKVDIQ